MHQVSNRRNHPSPGFLIAQSTNSNGMIRTQPFPSIIPSRRQLLQVARLGDLDAAARGCVSLLGPLGQGVVDFVLGGFGLALEIDARVALAGPLGADLELGFVEDVSVLVALVLVTDGPWVGESWAMW